MKRAGWILSFLFALPIIGGLGCARTDIGLRNGRLLPCPNSPNCVSSQDEKKSHKIAPLAYSCSKEKARKKLETLLKSMAGCEIKSKSDDYIHAIFKSRLFRFTDDVEFYFPEKPGLIHVRSASRIGYYDFGVNRKRVEKIRELFSEMAGKP